MTEEQEARAERLEGKPIIYVNVFRVQAGPFDFTFSFGHKTPEQSGSGDFNELFRIAMSPTHAKMMHRILGGSIAAYEKQLGKIPLPKLPETKGESSGGSP